MTAKKIVQEFYKSDVLLDSEKVKAFLHPDVVLEWHSSKGFHKLKKQITSNFAFFYNIFNYIF